MLELPPPLFELLEALDEWEEFTEGPEFAALADDLVAAGLLQVRA